MTVRDPVELILGNAEQSTRNKLRGDGYSDSYIDARVAADDNMESGLAYIDDHSQQIHEYGIALLRHIAAVRVSLQDEESFLDGYLIIYLQLLSCIDDFVLSLKSVMQSEIAKGPRNRTTLAKRMVEFVLKEAPEFPGSNAVRRSLEGQNNLDAALKAGVGTRGRDLSRFRHYVGEERRLLGEGIDLEVTAIEDHDGRIIEYDIYDCDTHQREIVKDSTIRSIIHRMNKSTRKLGVDS